MGEEEEERTFFRGAATHWLPSNAKDDRTVQLEHPVLPLDERGKMPLTKSKYLVREDPELIYWERVVRQFLRKLSPEHQHRVSAVMIWEWATGEQVGTAPYATGTSVFRKLNKILRFYFGKPYMTWIANKKVPNCYNVRPGYYIRQHRPMTTELWLEYTQGVLYP